MVDQVATKEETSNGAHGESPNEKKASQGNKDSKKKAQGVHTTRSLKEYTS